MILSESDERGTVPLDRYEVVVGHWGKPGRLEDCVRSDLEASEI
jgi:hypothetical protein